MHYSHNVSEEWLRSRSHFLTATEAITIAQATDKTRENKMLKIWASKQVIKPDTASPSQAAARGHVLEPYAVEEWNRLLSARYTKFYHWDDALIYRDGIAFSPDALDIQQPAGYVNCLFDLFQIKPKEMMEIKSYSPENHYERLVTNKEDIPERWQVAYGMLVAPSIEQAHIVFYNPNCRHPMYPFTYEYPELETEREALQKAVYDWERFCEEIQKKVPLPLFGVRDEEEVYADWSKKESLKSSITKPALGLEQLVNQQGEPLYWTKGNPIYVKRS